MRMLALSPLLALLFTACTNTHAGSYIIDPAPLWQVAPTATPVVEAVDLSGTVAVAALSPTPTVKRKKNDPTDTPTATATETPTPTLTPTQATGIYLVPFQDKRRNPEIWSGRSVYEKVIMEPSGATMLAKAWRTRPFSDMSFFWHRQFAYAMASSGYSVQAAELPLDDQSSAMGAARNAGAKILVSGQIKRLNMVKKGADDFLGTNFTGSNYYLNVEVQLHAYDVNTGAVLVDKKLEFQRLFYDPTRLGSNDRDTYPRYFATGLPELALKAAGENSLLLVAGLPTFTSTPTTTPTPEVQAPKKGDTPTVEPTATPDTGPYWVNPKTGNKVDPTWNFDPADGTPRDKFILRQPEAPAPKRATEAK